MSFECLCTTVGSQLFGGDPEPALLAATAATEVKPAWGGGGGRWWGPRGLFYPG